MQCPSHVSTRTHLIMSPFPQGTADLDPVYTPRAAPREAEPHTRSTSGHVPNPARHVPRRVPRAFGWSRYPRPFLGDECLFRCRTNSTCSPTSCRQPLLRLTDRSRPFAWHRQRPVVITASAPSPLHPPTNRSRRDSPAQPARSAPHSRACPLDRRAAAHRYDGAVGPPLLPSSGANAAR